MLTAVRENKGSLAFLSKSLKSDEEFMLAAMQPAA